MLNCAIKARAVVSVQGGLSLLKKKEKKIPLLDLIYLLVLDNINHITSVWL